ncbi:hypothetical protein Poli38472_000439 [Pythium oligandrum]|uniref:Uncharacterized protein n=1 Tax=Pythium oligandrum TaxID=41045 RepID=A0A8K1CBY3_PYTOL|nr:hypothetical protein Poli38472_000439 [Pythium oligandrum]|eukprot:TMW60397.1 hypothetical protein Poli38472_000439 [Pythium oligandrum]
MEQASAEAKTMRLEAVCRLYSGFLCTAASHSIAELDFSLAARQLEIRKQSENDVEVGGFHPGPSSLLANSWLTKSMLSLIQDGFRQFTYQ